MILRLMFSAITLLALPSLGNADGSRLALLDQAVVVAHPETTYQIATSIGRPDENGLIGRNREWRDLYTVRFQYGAGRAMRHGHAINDPTLIDLSRQAISVGLESVREDGAFPASVPPEISQGRTPSLADQASAAAFFLSDACPALLIAGATTREQMQIDAAMGWLGQRTDLLLTRDRGAPNRLLISALAFVSCGQLLAGGDMTDQADRFVAAALKLIRPDGVFLEAAGSDTSYQAVNIVTAIEIDVLTQSDQSRSRIRAAIQSGGTWLADRISTDGSLDSSANTRTCANEEFLGRPKDVDLREVFRALAYLQAYDASVLSDIEAFETWLLTRPEACGELD